MEEERQFKLLLSKMIETVRRDTYADKYLQLHTTPDVSKVFLSFTYFYAWFLQCCSYWLEGLEFGHWFSEMVSQHRLVLTRKNVNAFAVCPEHCSQFYVWTNLTEPFILVICSLGRLRRSSFNFAPSFSTEPTIESFSVLLVSGFGAFCCPAIWLGCRDQIYQLVQISLTLWYQSIACLVTLIDLMAAVIEKIGMRNINLGPSLNLGLSLIAWDTTRCISWPLLFTERSTWPLPYNIFSKAVSFWLLRVLHGFCKRFAKQECVNLVSNAFPGSRKLCRGPLSVAVPFCFCWGFWNATICVVYWWTSSGNSCCCS